MPGTLIPPWFHPDIPTRTDEVIVSVIWGFSLGLSLFGVIRAGNQTYHQWQRTRRVTTYMVLIWLELITSTIIGGIGWGYVHLSIPPSFEFFFFLLFLWVFQIHCIMQIIVNRIALLAVSPTIVRRLRWGIFFVLASINISVFCIWIPARLQISNRWGRLNDIWDRVEKGIFALVDAGLNFYFIYLVRSSLISYGLTRYVVLYRFNLVMIGISIGMDILIIGMMSFGNTFLYVLFHPLAYLVKLHIEMWMADLIAKIVKAAGVGPACHCACHHTHVSHHESSLLPTSNPPDRSRRLAPTTGRFRRLWPMWSGKRSELNQPQNNTVHMKPPKKAARAEVFRLHRFSWHSRCVERDSAVAMSSLPSSMGESSRSNDHQD